MPPSGAEDSRRCPDCSAEAANPEARYCAACGQRLDIPNLRVREVLREILGSITSMELPILRTLRDLLRGPGSVAEAWIAGRRRTYIHPIKLLVILGVLIALTYEPLIRLRLDQSPGEPVFQGGLAHHATQYFCLFAILLVAPIAWVLAPVARALGIRRSWLHWYILALYCYGLGAGLQLVFNGLYVLLPNSIVVPVSQVEGLLPVGLLCWGAFGFAPRAMRLQGALAAFLTQFLLVLILVLTAQWL